MFKSILSSDDVFNYLLKSYEAKCGITRETPRKGQVRYRHKPVANAMGIWISKRNAQKQLEQAFCDSLCNATIRKEDSYEPKTPPLETLIAYSTSNNEPPKFNKKYLREIEPEPIPKYKIPTHKIILPKNYCLPKKFTKDGAYDPFPKDKK